jgi:hypothetical protein
MQLKHAMKFIKSVTMSSSTMPILNSIHVYDGRIQVGNTNVVIDIPHSPFKGLNFTAPLDLMIKAIMATDHEFTVAHDAEVNKITIRKGSFKAAIPLLTHDDYPLLGHAKSKSTPCGADFIEKLAMLRPFAGNTFAAPHHWQNGICFRDGFAYATNNVTVAQVVLGDGKQIPKETTVNLDIIDTLSSIGDRPEQISLEDNFILFKYHCGGWVRCRLMENTWPTSIEGIFSRAAADPVPEGLGAAVNSMIPFAADDVFFGGPDGIRTPGGDCSARDEGFALPVDCSYKLSELKSILALADKFDFGAYPSSRWSGPGIEGYTAGRRLDDA